MEAATKDRAGRGAFACEALRPEKNPRGRPQGIEDRATEVGSAAGGHQSIL